MKYRIYDKAISVIDSCTTKEQFTTACKFCLRAIGILEKDNTPFCDSAIDAIKFFIYERKQEFEPKSNSIYGMKQEDFQRMMNMQYAAASRANNPYASTLQGYVGVQK